MKKSAWIVVGVFCMLAAMIGLFCLLAPGVENYLTSIETVKLSDITLPHVIGLMIFAWFLFK